MSREIKESDWKVLRQLHPVALQRFCQRILDEIQAITSDTARDSHARYLEIYELVRRRDREIARVFDEMSRSRAFERILNLQSHRLLTEEEMARFSPEVSEFVQSWLKDSEEPKA